MRFCPECEELLALSDFGVCRYRKDGKNLYCKSCCRNKVSRNREKNRARRLLRKAAVICAPQVKPPTDEQPLTVEQSIREAIRNGNHSRQQIHEETGVSYQVISDVLAMLYDQGQARSERVNGDRYFYFVRERAA